MKRCAVRENGAKTTQSAPVLQAQPGPSPLQGASDARGREVTGLRLKIDHRASGVAQRLYQWTLLLGHVSRVAYENRRQCSIKRRAIEDGALLGARLPRASCSCERGAGRCTQTRRRALEGRDVERSSRATPHTRTGAHATGHGHSRTPHRSLASPALHSIQADINAPLVSYKRLTCTHRTATFSHSLVSRHSSKAVSLA